MRYCASCQKWVSDRPTYCSSCGRSWDYRICNKGHLNQINSQYCTQCGSSDLSETSGKEHWFSRMFGLKIGMLGKVLAGFIVILILSNLSQQFFEFIATFLIAIRLLLFTIKLIPQIIKKMFLGMFAETRKSIISRGKNDR